jgi:hypothetical protein
MVPKRLRRFLNLRIARAFGTTGNLDTRFRFMKSSGLFNLKVTNGGEKATEVEKFDPPPLASIHPSPLLYYSTSLLVERTPIIPQA